MLHEVVGKSNVERRAAINTIGPTWDGNEVWLIMGGASAFAAFPSWYATWFSAMYLALFILIVALILRGVSFEFRGKLHSARWQGTWRFMLTAGSVVIPLLVGIALGDLLVGLPINRQHEYTGHFVNLLTGFGIYTGVTFVLIALLAGACFLVMKTDDPLYRRSEVVAQRVSYLTAGLVIGFIIWSTLDTSGVIPNPLAIVAGLAALGAIWLTHTEHHGWAFGAACTAMVSSVATIFVNLYPNVMVSSTNPAYNLTVSNASSSSYSLKVMTVVAAVFLPIVLAYQTWSYWVFRKRVTTPRQPTVQPDSRPTVPAITVPEASVDGGARRLTG
jgi:cytochrome d ubiquinol oxidase subunit II